MSHVAPMRALNRPRPAVDVERQADGTFILSAGRSLPPDLPLVIDLLQRAAEHRPASSPFWPSGAAPARAWQRPDLLPKAWARTGAIASWLIAQGFGPDSKPIAILSDNSLERAARLRRPARRRARWRRSRPTLAVRRLHAPRPRCRSSMPAWCSRRTLHATPPPSIARRRASSRVDGKAAWPSARLASCSVDASVSERRLHITAETPAKILFTSGSTRPAQGRFKHPRQSRVGRRDEPLAGRAARPEPHRRVARLAALASHLGRQLQPERHHPLGQLLIYRRRPPLPGRFQETLENLRELSPSGFATVPAAYPLLLRGAWSDDADPRAPEFFKEPARPGLRRRPAAARRTPPCACRAWPRASSASVCPCNCGWGMTETTSVGLMVY